MSPLAIGLMGLAVLLIIMFIGAPIGLSMALTGFVGYVFIAGLGQAISMVGMTPYTSVASYTFSVLPMFLIMGEFASISGLMGEAYKTANTWLGRLPGGLAIATIAGCASFSAVCGSSVATAMTMTRVALPEMRKFRYAPSLATGCLAAGGTLGILIPPSGCFIIYGLMTSQSIGKLFMAGILPGILLAVLFMLTIYLQARLNPKLAPAGASANWRERIASLRGITGLFIVFVLVMGGIWLGIFTPTEAGAVGAFVTFIFVIGKKKLTRKSLATSFTSTIRTIGMTFIVLIGAMIFGYFITMAGLPKTLANFVTGLVIPPLGILICILLVYAILGCFMESLPMILLTIPIFFPVITALGYNPIWFGIVLTIMTEMAMITPPVGINVFVIQGMAKDIPMFTIFKGIWPFVSAMIFCLALLIAFPQIALILPNTMIGK